jgi:hypothetical protein
MAKADISFKDQVYNSVPTMTWQTEANATAIYAGEPTKVKSAGSKYVIPLADGDGVIGTTVAVTGIAKSDSTHTASADGSVDVYMPLPGIIYACKAKSSTAADTQSEIDALKGKRVVVDLTSSSYTIDTAASDHANNAFLIVGGDPARSVIYFQLRTNITIFGTTL